MPSDAIPQQSRAATGVKLQRLDAGDRLTEVVLVPPAAEDDGSDTLEPVSDTLALSAETVEPAGEPAERGSEAGELTGEEDS
jgi:DNA gyrase subunit A